MKRLIDLPGVAELEARLQRIEAHPSPAWAPEADGLAFDVLGLARTLFGIGDDQTKFCEAEDGADLSDEEFEAADAEWELHFALLHPETEDRLDQMVKVFEAMGWDICNANGGLLLAAIKLGRPLVCAIKGLNDAHLPGAPMTDDQAKEAAGSWGSALEAEAAKFKGKRK